MLAFFEYPAEHWSHLRTSNPIESVFATVRHRTVQTVPMTDDEGATHAKLLAVYRALEEEYSGQNEFPEEIDIRLGELEAKMENLRSFL